MSKSDRLIGLPRQGPSVPRKIPASGQNSFHRDQHLLRPERAGLSPWALSYPGTEGAAQVVITGDEGLREGVGASLGVGGSLTPSNTHPVGS